MNFVCDKCQRRYALPDDKVRGKIVKVRCKNCQNLISIGPLEAAAPASEPVRAGPQAPWDDEPTKHAPTLDRTVQWFAMVKGAQTGPFDFTQLHRSITTGEFSQRTYLWRQGMPDWKRAQEIPELQPMFTAVKSEPPQRAASGPPLPSLSAANEEVTRSVTSQELFAEAEAAAMVAEVTAPRALAPRRTAETLVEPEPEVAEDDDEEPTHIAAPEPADLGGELFSDLDFGTAAGQHQVPSPGEKKRGKKKKEEEPEEDPFALVAALDPDKMPVNNESTSFFIAQAGVNKRNPPWKIATFIGVSVGLPVALLYMLSAMQVVRLEVTQKDDQGNEVKSSVFSAQGLSGLGRTLLGTKKPTAPVALRPKPERRAEKLPVSTSVASRATPDAVAQVKGKRQEINVSPDLRALYEDQGKRDVGPNMRKAKVAAAEPSAPGGPPEDAVAKVVGQTQPAFQFCIEQQLKKNPGFRGGKVSLIATVAASGTVKRASISKVDIDTSDLGQCIKGKARRMVFPSFEGDDVDLDIPLILTTSL